MKHRLRQRYGHTAMPAKLVWHTYAGGTSAHPNVNSYDAKGLWGQYTIDPMGHHRRPQYRLMWANMYSYPAEHSGLWHDLGLFASPSRAKKAAAEHLRELKSTAVG